MNNDLNAENKDLREKVNAYTDKVNGLQANLGGALRETQSLMGKMKEKDVELSNAAMLRNNLKFQLERQDEDAKILHRTVDKLTRELVDLKRSSGNTTVQLRQTSQQLAQRNDELRMASSLASDKADALDSSKEEVQRLRAALESANVDNIRLTEETGNAALLSSELLDKVHLKTEEITALNGAARIALQEFKALRASKKTADKEKQVIENEMKLLQKDYHDMGKEKHRLEQELSKAQELQQALEDMKQTMRVHHIGKTGDSLAKQHETDLMAEIDNLSNQLKSEKSISASGSASLKAIKGAVDDSITSLRCSLGLETTADADGTVDGNTGVALAGVCELVYAELSRKERCIRSQREALAQAEKLASNYAIEVNSVRADVSKHIADISQARETISLMSEKLASAKAEITSKEEELSNAAMTISSQRRELRAELSQQAGAHAPETPEAPRPANWHPNEGQAHQRMPQQYKYPAAQETRTNRPYMMIAGSVVAAACYTCLVISQAEMLLQKMP